MKILKPLFSSFMIVILLFSCFACAEAGADIETVGTVSEGVFTIYIDQTEFTVEEAASFDVHFKVEGAKEIDTAPPLLEKYTHSGWSSEDYYFQCVAWTLNEPVDSVFTHQFSFASVGGATVEPGVYRLKYGASTTVDGTEHSGVFYLIFRVV